MARHPCRAKRFYHVGSTAWIAADEARSGEDIHVSLRDLAEEVLERQRGKHLGQLADPERHALVRPAGDGRLEVGGDGVTVRAPGVGEHGASRGDSRRAAARHKYGTVGKERTAADTKKAP